MPVLFIGHGSPMNAIELNEFSQSWIEAGRSVPRPKAILCISAHWETDGTFVTAMEQPRTIHDFYGFPEELFEVQYPAPGSPDLARSIRGIVRKTTVHLDHGWGLDHGAWTVLCRMYPDVGIPVIQLSLDRSKEPRFHYELGRELRALRDRGVLIIGSGNIVHNLGMMRWQQGGFDWAVEFDGILKELILTKDHDTLYHYTRLGRAADLGVPTNEHFLPLLYILALQQEGEKVSFFAEKVTLGSISMRSFWIREDSNSTGL
jgi:4,5-DOPA dioxygenase extradiol